MTDLVILVGGKGSRLGKLTLKRPKPLIKIDNKRFLDILLIKVIKYNFKNIYLLCSYKKKSFFDLYHNKMIHNSRIICIDEGSQKDTGGALYKIKKRIKKNFFLINGDSYFDIDLNFLKKSINKKQIGVLAITKNRNYKKNTKINNISIDKTGLLKFSKSKTNLMNGGIYYFKKEIFNYIENKKLSLENEIIKKLIFEKKMKGHFFDNKFIDIGSKKNLNFAIKNPNFFKQNAFFLDRDGVINRLIKNDYVRNIKQFRFLPGVFKAIKFLNKNNYIVIIITNQACVGKLIISEKKLNSIHIFMMNEIKKNDAKIDDILYSPYFKDSKIKRYRDGLNDRKPNPGMLIKAIKKWNVNINKSFFIGDSLSDLNASKKVNLKFFYKTNDSLINQVRNIIHK